MGGWVRGVRVRQEMSNEKESERDARRERERERGVRDGGLPPRLCRCAAAVLLASANCIL